MKNVNQVRLVFLREISVSVRLIWPVLSGIFIVIIALGIVVGYIENWSIGDGIYFAFVTGLTVGYGDLTPTHMLSRWIAVWIGFTGIVMAALLAGVSMRALQAAQEYMQTHPTEPASDGQ